MVKSKNNIVKAQGKCTKALPGAKFYIKLDNTSQLQHLEDLNNISIIAKICGKMMNRKIRLNVNDNVEIEFPYSEILNLVRSASTNIKKHILGRIVKRLPIKNNR